MALDPGLHTALKPTLRLPCTRRGTPAVVVVAVEDYERLCQAEKESASTFVDHLLAFPQGGEEFERMPLEARPLDI